MIFLLGDVAAQYRHFPLSGNDSMQIGADFIWFHGSCRCIDVTISPGCETLRRLLSPTETDRVSSLLNILLHPPPPDNLFMPALVRHHVHRCSGRDKHNAKLYRGDKRRWNVFWDDIVKWIRQTGGRL